MIKQHESELPNIDFKIIAFNFQFPLYLIVLSSTKMVISLELTASTIWMGFLPNYSSKYEAYIGIENQIFIFFEFRLMLLDRITHM